MVIRSPGRSKEVCCRCHREEGIVFTRSIGLALGWVRVDSGFNKLWDANKIHCTQDDNIRRTNQRPHLSCPYKLEHGVALRLEKK